MKQLGVWIFILGLFFGFSSCEDEQSGDVYLPVKITKVYFTTNNSFYYDQEIRYTYDNHNQMKNRVIKTTNPGRYVRSDTLSVSYDSENNPRDYYSSEKILYSDGRISWRFGNVIMLYNGNKLRYAYDGEPTDEFEIDLNGRIVEIDGEYPQYKYDSVGNIIKFIAEYGDISYSYDNSKGIFRDVVAPEWFWIKTRIGDAYFRTNNLIKEDTSLEYVYQYNEKGYPISYKIYRVVNPVEERKLFSEVKIEYIVR